MQGRVMTRVASVRAELKRMYNETTPATIEQDLARAISLLKPVSYTHLTLPTNREV